MRHQNGGGWEAIWVFIYSFIHEAIESGNFRSFFCITRYQKHVADEDKEAIQKALQTYMASEDGVPSSSSVHFEDGLESS